MKNFNNVKNIQFKLILDGYGCVNFDSPEQVYFLLKANIGGSQLTNGGKALQNVLLTKKNFHQTEDGSYEYHVKVSAECLRHSIFKKTMAFQSPTAMNLPQVLYRAIANPDLLLRGYVFTQGSGKSSLKRKSPFYMTDAEEIGNWRKNISLDFHSRSGEKESNNGKGSEDVKDTSIYNIENIGAVKYQAEGGIDVQELRFISADPLYDRMAIDVDGGVNEKIFIDELEKNMVNFKPEFKYYFMENSYTADEWAERGILLNNESVDMLIKRAIKQILEINEIRRNAYLRTEKLIVIVNCENGESHEVEMTLDNYNDFTFNCVNSYKESDDTKIYANKERIEVLKEISKQEKKSKSKDTKNNK